jgi:hypothetical protein
VDGGGFREVRLDLPDHQLAALYKVAAAVLGRHLGTSGELKRNPIKLVLKKLIKPKYS